MLKRKKFTSIFLFIAFTSGPTSYGWKPSHLVKLGSSLKIKCPHTFKDLGVEWELEKPDGTPVELSKEETLVIDPGELKHSGKYSCFENVMRDGEIKFEHHKTQVLVVDYRCSKINGDTSQNMECSINYQSDTGGGKIQVYRLCKPPDAVGELVVTQDRTDGSVVYHELIVEREKQDCIFMIKFLNSSLRLWPSSYDSDRGCSDPESHDVKNAGDLASAMHGTSAQFFLTIILPILSNCIVVVLTITLTCLVILTNKKTKAKGSYAPNAGEYLSSFKPPPKCQVVNNTRPLNDIRSLEINQSSHKRFNLKPSLPRDRRINLSE